MLGDEITLYELKQKHGARWDIWKVPAVISPTAWCAKPLEASTSVLQETSSDALDAWLTRVSALMDQGVTFEFSARGWKRLLTASWIDKSGTRARRGPEPVSDVLDYVEAELKEHQAPT